MNDILLAKVIDIGATVDDINKKTGAQSAVTNSSAAPKIKNIFWNIELAALWLVGIAAVMTIIYGGLLYITAGGDSEKAEKGKKVIIGAVIAIIIIATSLIAYNLIPDLLQSGVSALK